MVFFSVFFSLLFSEERVELRRREARGWRASSMHHICHNYLGHNYIGHTLTNEWDETNGTLVK